VIAFAVLSIALALPRVRSIRLALLGLVLGLLLAPRGPDRVPAEHLAGRLGTEPVLVALRGRATSALEPLRGGLLALDLRVESLRVRDGSWRTVRGPLRALVRGAPEKPVLPGDRIRVVGTARPLRRPTNPGEPDTGIRPRREGRHHILLVESPSSLRVLRSGRSPLGLVARLRSAAARRLVATLPGSEGGLAGALILGRRAGVPEASEEAFRRCGAAHLLAVSGLHVGLVAGAVWGLLGILRVPDRWRAIVLASVALGYAALAGLRPPVVRAAVVTGLLAGSVLARRRTGALDLLGATAFLVLLARPGHAHRVDFQLSFVAATGLVLLHGRVGRALFPSRDLDRRFAAWRSGSRVRRMLRDYVHRVLPASVAAWVSTAPLVLHHFGVLAPLAPLATLALLPLLLLSLAASAAALLLGPGTGLGPILGLPLAALDAGARLLAAIPGSGLEGPRPTVLPVLAAYAILGLLALRSRWGRARLALAVAAPFVLFLSGVPRSPPETDRLMVLDVGQGSSVLVERADGGVLLYDAGSTRPAIGRRLIAPVLRARRIRRLDVLVLSHADADHVSGVRTLLDRFRVALLVVPPRFSASAPGRAVLEHARRRRVPVREVSAGDELAPFGEILHPPRGVLLDDNDGSLVLRVGLGRHRVLLTGDIEEKGVESLLRHRDPAAEIVVLPHHGARNARLPALLAAAAPTGAVSSASRGFAQAPLPDGLRRWRTAEHGAVTLLDGPLGLEVRSFLDRRQVPGRTDR
jgi:competence protein ComEC